MDTDDNRLSELIQARLFAAVYAHGNSIIPAWYEINGEGYLIQNSGWYMNDDSIFIYFTYKGHEYSTYIHIGD